MSDQDIEVTVELETTEDIPWLAIPVIGLVTGLMAFMLLGALRLLVAGFIAAFIPSESSTILPSIWNNGRADAFIEATHFIHGQFSYIVGLVTVPFLIVVKLLGGKFRTKG